MACRVQDEWAVSKVFNKELTATNGAMAAAADAGIERVSSFGFISDFLDSGELPPLMDPSFGGDVDEVVDFKGPASTSAYATGAHSGLQVKMEQHMPLQPPHMMYSSPYFSLPAANSGDLSPAIRRYCKAEQVSGQTSALSPSRETGLSTDPNAAGCAEISSAATPSSQNQEFLDHLDEYPALNLADIWKY